MKIISQGHAFTAQGASYQVLFSYPCLHPINAIKNVACCVDAPTFPNVHQQTDTVDYLSLSFASQGQNRRADTVLQPDLYSGQAVYYIKKVLVPL